MNSKIVFLVAAAFAVPASAAWGPSGGYAPAPIPANIALSSDGQNVLDTPEVAQARAAHFAAVSQAQTNAAKSNPNDDGSYDSRWEKESEYAQAPQWNAAPAQPQQQWNAAPAQQQWNAAPAQPQQQWNAAPAQQQYSAAPAQQQYNAAPAQQQYNAAPAYRKYAPANIALSADGQHVLDTPEVAQARAAHLAAFASANARTAPAAPAQQWNAAPAQQQWSAAPAQQQYHAAPVQQQYSGVPAQQQWNAAPAQSAPVWNGAPSWQSAPAQNKWANAPSQIKLSQDGQNVLDTADVANARAAHLAAHAAASALSAPAHAAPAHWQ